MIDNFALLVSHGLVLIVFWRLLKRADLDSEAPPEGRSRRGFERESGQDRAD